MSEGSSNDAGLNNSNYKVGSSRSPPAEAPEFLTPSEVDSSPRNPLLQTSTRTGSAGWTEDLPQRRGKQ